MNTFRIKGNVFCSYGEILHEVDTVISGNFDYCQDALIAFFDDNGNYFNSFTRIGCDTDTRGQISSIFVDRFDNDRFLYVDLIS